MTTIWIMDDNDADTLMETLIMDSKSGNIDTSVRHDILQAVDSIRDTYTNISVSEISEIIQDALNNRKIQALQYEYHQ